MPKVSSCSGGAARALIACAVCTLAGCVETAKSDVAPVQPPAKVEPIAETVLNRVTLTEDANKRLGIELADVRRAKLPRTLRTTARVVLPTGRSLTIAAPVAGTLLPAPGAQLLPGKAFAAGQTVLRLLPLLAPGQNAVVETRRDFEMARARTDNARKQAERMKLLGQEGAGDQSAYETAQAEVAFAEAELSAASRRVERLSGRNPLAADVTLPMSSPIDGVVLRVHASPGAWVAAGAPLIEIANLDRVWLETEVFAGSAAELDRAAEGRVLGLGATDKPQPARPLQAPALGAANGTAVMLLYEVDNLKAGFAPGQRVIVHVPLRGGQQERDVVPWSAIVYDVHGDTWVYTSAEPLQFVRARVQVERIDCGACLHATPTGEGELAVLASGPPPGTHVVTLGAAELLGTELGIGK